MLVRTKRAHDNPFGKNYRKKEGDTYEHPDPAADLHFGYIEVVEDDTAEGKASDAEPALSGMTKDELIALAEAEGVDLSDATNNEDRRAIIEAARG